MTPKIVDKEKRRAQIARTAMGLFAENGFENTPVREIARAAGMGKGTFYEYFADKSGVLNEIAAQMVKRWEEEFAAVAAQHQNPAQTLEALVGAGISLAGEFEQATALYVELMRKGGMEGREAGFVRVLKGFLDDCHEMLRGLIEAGKAEGAYRPGADAGAVATMLLALIDGVALQSAILAKDTNFAAAWKGFCAVLLAGLRA